MAPLSEKTNPPLIVGIGEVLWDCLPSGRKLGGAPANFVYQAHALGNEGVLISRIGDDAEGREALSRLQNLGIDVDYVQTDASFPTGTVDVTVDRSGEPDYVIHENVAWDNLQYLGAMDELAQRASVVCTGSLASRSETSRRTILRFLENVPDVCIRVLDVNLRQQFYDREIIHALLRHTEVLKLNEEELPVIAAYSAVEGDTVAQVKALRRMWGLSAVALTRQG